MPLHVPPLITAKAASGGGAPRDLARNGLHDSRAGLGLCHRQRRLAVKLRQSPAKPRICLCDIPKGFFGECLHTQKSDSPVRFFDSERLLFLGVMTACALGIEEHSMKGAG